MASSHNHTDNICRAGKPLKNANGTWKKDASGAAMRAPPGKQLAAAVAYVTRTELRDPETLISYGYESRGEDLVGSEVLLPDGAPESLRDLQQLVDAMESAEDRHDARTGKEGNFVLPRELPREEWMPYARAFLQKTMVSKGVPVLFAVHEGLASDGELNVHCHWIAGTRRIDPKTGLFEGKKAGLLDTRAQIHSFREDFETYTNSKLADLGSGERIHSKRLWQQAQEYRVVAKDESKPAAERAAAAELAELLTRNPERRQSPKLFMAKKKEIGAPGHLSSQERSRPVSGLSLDKELFFRARQQRAKLVKSLKESIRLAQARAAILKALERTVDAWSQAVDFFRPVSVVKIGNQRVVIEDRPVSTPILIPVRTPPKPTLIQEQPQEPILKTKRRRPMTNEEISRQRRAIEMRRRAAQLTNDRAAILTIDRKEAATPTWQAKTPQEQTIAKAITQ